MELSNIIFVFVFVILLRIDFGYAQCCDTDVTAFSIDPTTYNGPNPVSFTYSVTVKNTDTANTIAAVTGANINYKVFIKFTQYDLRSVGQASDIVTGGVDPAVAPGTLEPDAANQVSLNPNGEVTFTGGAEITVPDADCSLIKYICVHVFDNLGDSPSYVDDIDYNDWRCNAVTSICPVDVQMTNFNPPTSIIYGKTTTEATTFTVTNLGTTPAHDIAAVSNTNKNYQIDVYLSTSDAQDQTGFLGSPLPVTWTSTLQEALANSQTLNLEGSVAYVLPTDNTCSTVTHICAKLIVPTTASYEEPTTADPLNNVNCQALAGGAVSCAPVFNNLPDTVQVAEDQTSVNPLFTVNVDGPVTYTFAVAPALPGLTIDAAGVVSLTGTFDFETDAQKQYVMSITATGDAGEAATESLTIDITDVNEDPVLTITNTAANTVTIDEDFSGSMTGLYTVTKDDPDLPPSPGAQTMKYSIISQTPNDATNGPQTGPFSIDPTNGILSVSTSPVKLDFDDAFANVWEVVISGVDEGAPGPPQKSASVTLTVSLTNIAEPPQFINLPTSIDVLENETDTLRMITLQMWDPENDTITLTMMPNPLDDKFIKTDKDIAYKADPRFDYETTPKYDIRFFATDGSTEWNTDVFTVNIIDVDEPPWFLDLPTNITVSENFLLGAELFYIRYDSTPNNPATSLKFNSSYVPSGMDKFRLFEPSGLVHTRWRPDLNYEVDNRYNLTFDLCSKKGLCVRENLTVLIEDENEYPKCDPSNFTLTVSENQEINKNTGLKVTSNTGYKYVTDPDPDDTHGAGIFTSTYSDFIKVYKGEVQLSKKFDFDSHIPPHKFTTSIMVTDSDPDDPKNLSGLKGLKCYHLLTVEVTNEDDQFPAFDNLVSSYTIDVMEDAPAGFVLGNYKVRDTDLGQFGMVSMTVDPANALATKYFAMGPVTYNNKENFADLLVAGKLDVEADTVVTFNIEAKDTKRPVTQEIIVRIHNVNDKRPYFKPDFYNWEVSTTAEVGKFLIQVTAMDEDIIYRKVSYHLVHPERNEFTLNSLDGKITTKTPPYPEWHKYVLYMTAKDNDPNPDVSLVARTRIDTYVNEYVLTNWTVNCDVSKFKTQAQIDQFLKDVATVCPPCVARVHSMHQSAGQTKFVLYFLTDDATFYLGNIGITKTYIPAETIMELYTVDQIENPTPAVKSTPALSACPVTSITWYLKPEDDFNWILDTVEGNITLGVIMSIIWTSIMTATICLGRYCFGERGYPRKVADTPSKNKRPKPRAPTRQATAVSQSAVEVDGDFEVMDFRYADRAHIQDNAASKVQGTV